MLPKTALWLNLSDIPLNLRQAIIAIEDAEFYQHSGFPPAVSPAPPGAPSPTSSWKVDQPLPSSWLKPPSFPRTHSAPQNPRVGSLCLSRNALPQRSNLEMYLNRVSFGGAAYGVEEAAQTYFAKPASKLTLAESALLAGLPASPTTYSPVRSSPRIGQIPPKEVLRRMVSEGFITWEQADAASSEELRFTPNHRH